MFVSIFISYSHNKIQLKVKCIQIHAMGFITKKLRKNKITHRYTHTPNHT